ncbi:hypothetical protein PK98_12295 [Croceibacterium mercuriale]|uniref:Uncharacterized protein n=1 Tax=Croceibacterium mercuriale TaxID=1572751 RepID=A0A0B2BT70_9SPHN|nr:hypothetical protein [Croceibacterium mercuriale]KHL24713.1 hypothetical protein PK98_12295 [Croceibacterium mercuriale]
MSGTVRPSAICGLLYCGDRTERHANVGTGGGDPLLLYVRNALTLAGSLRQHGQAFTLLVNDAARVDALVAQAGGTGSVAVEEVAFTLDVPPGVRFYSAHFKLELLRLFAEGRFGPFPALLDLDVVALKPLEFPDRPGLWAYDIAHEILGGPKHRAAIASLEQVARVPLDTQRWFGGEFLAGRQADFAGLWQTVAHLWPTYRDAVGSDMYHSGDEMVLSAALNRLIDNGYALNDAGAAGLVARWWSVPMTRRLGRLADAQQCAILHLPADKHLLARPAAGPFVPAAFMAELRADVARRRKGLRNTIRAIAHHLKGRRFAPLLD